MEESSLRYPEIGRIDQRIAAWLAWSLCALSLVLTGLSLWLVALNHSKTMQPEHVSLWLRPGTMLGDRRVRR